MSRYTALYTASSRRVRLPHASPLYLTIMKPLRYILLLSALSSLFAAAQPALRFQQVRNELGQVLWNTPATVRFTFTNTGNEALQLLEVRPDCGCTAVSFPQAPVAPGATASIEATYDAALLGHFEKQLAVVSNASRAPLYLTLSGDVVDHLSETNTALPYRIGDVYLESDNVEFDDVHRGDDPVRVLRVYNGGRQTFAPSLMHLPRYLSAEAVPSNIRPGRTGELRLRLHTGELRTFGLSSTNIYLSRFAGDRVSRDNEIFVSAMLLPEFAYSDDELQRAPVAQLDSTTLHLAVDVKGRADAQAVLTNTGASPLSIRALQVYNPGLNVSIGRTQLKPGAATKIKIRVNAESGYFKGRRRVLLITNDPKQPKIVIDVVVKK